MTPNQYTAKEERQFNAYLRQFSETYRVRRGDDGIYEIPCRNGDIEPYSMTELCCYQIGSGRAMPALKRKLPTYCTITCEATHELIFRFPKENLSEIAEIVHAKRRVHLSEEARQKLREAFAVRKSPSFQKTQGNTPLPGPRIDDLAVGVTKGTPP